MKVKAPKNLYPYLRWVWMQFPWLALHPAASLALQDLAAGSTGMDSGTYGDSGEDGQVPGGPGFQSAAGDENVRLQRIWNCKKSDPTVPIISKSTSRQAASLKPK
jgi:hypothetical protein